MLHAATRRDASQQSLHTHHVDGFSTPSTSLRAGLVFVLVTPPPRIINVHHLRSVDFGPCSKWLFALIRAPRGVLQARPTSTPFPSPGDVSLPMAPPLPSTVPPWGSSVSSVACGVRRSCGVLFNMWWRRHQSGNSNASFVEPPLPRLQNCAFRPQRVCRRCSGTHHGRGRKIEAACSDPRKSPSFRTSAEIAPV